MPIRQGSMFANRVSTWPRDHLCRSTIIPRRSMPTGEMGSSRYRPLPTYLLTGQEHGRTIRIADIDGRLLPNFVQRRRRAVLHLGGFIQGTAVVPTVDGGLASDWGQSTSA